MTVADPLGSSTTAGSRGLAGARAARPSGVAAAEQRAGGEGPGRIRQAARAAGVLGLLTATLPVNLALAGAATLRRTPSGAAVREAPARRRTVLVTGGKMTKALVLARAFHAAGHRVLLAEQARYRLTAHRTSRAVDAFHVLPTPGSDGYEQAVLDLVRAEGVDTFVPVSSPASSLPEAEVGELLRAEGVEVVHLDAERLRAVDDKHAFAAAAAAAGLPVPDTYRITDPQQVLDLDFDALPGAAYVLKSIAYDPVRRLDLTPLPRPTRAETEAFLAGLPISEERPWILQELLEGTEWCTHGTVRDGRLAVHVACRSSAWQLVYEHEEHRGIRAWVEQWVRDVLGPGATGQVSLDFIEGPDGVVRAIECNPRTHSAITLLEGHPDLAAAYLGGDPDVHEREQPVEPELGGAPTYWTHHELWQGLTHPRTLPERLRLLRRGRDAVLTPTDPWPFLALHHLHVPSLVLANLRAGRPWQKVDLNIGKLVEPGGD